MKITIDMYGNKEYNLSNGSKVVFFNKKWNIFNPVGIAFPDKYNSLEEAINRVIKIYNLKDKYNGTN